MTRRFQLPAAIAHPVRLLPLAFMVLIAVGTALLSLPVARSGKLDVSIADTFFTATSAVTVTGLATVDTGTAWSVFGHIVIVILVELGGIGIIAMATILGLFIGGRLGLRSRLVAQADMHVVSIGDVTPLFRRIIVMTFSFQAVTAIILMLRYRAKYYGSWSDSLWHAIFDAVMAFNNAGLSLHPDSLTQYSGDFAVLVPISVAVFFGAIGFPVMAELYKGWRRPKAWTIHTRLTVWGSLILLVLGSVTFLVSEWYNPATLADQSFIDKIATSLEGSVMTRSGGLNSFDWSQTRPETLSIGIIMMFIGGGSASTAGGIKVTTFFLLAFVILAELRGDPEVRIGNRSVSGRTIRTALSVALIAVMLVTAGSLALMTFDRVEPVAALFEAASAFGTVGLSTGLTAELSTASKLVLVILMFVGRVGTITAASAFVMRRRQPRFHLPEEQPIIG